MIELRRIPGYTKYWASETGEIFSDYIGRYIKQTVRTYNNSGYKRIGLVIDGQKGKYKYYYVHQLVMLAFHGPCPDGLEIDHINLDGGDNRLINLRYVTHKENVKSRRHSNQFLKKLHSKGV